MRTAIPLVLCLSLVVLTLLPGGPVAAEPAPGLPAAPPDGVIDGGKIAPEVEARLAALRPGEMTTVIVTLSDQADLSRIPGPGPGASRAARIEGVVRALRARAQASQRPIRALLAARAAQGLVGDVRPFWVFNGLAVTATERVVRELAARADVARITPDEISIVPAETGSIPETNLSVINAPTLWDLGYDGQGVVVANLDTGVDASHPDLASRWRGGTNSWFDPFGEHPDTPTDLDGHGTWTMGVMVGGDGGGTGVGVAPGAEWIAVKIFDDRGDSKASAIHQAFEWLLDPDGDPTTADAPHVVNNSWTSSSAGCNLEFELDLQSLRAATILPVFAAGNGGPDAATSHSPANNPSAFAVGATDDTDQIAAFSSRGPSSCGEAETIFPELVAPGVGIHTADLYGLYTDGTGTSLAAPHVAGGLALLLSADPDLTHDQQQEALTTAAVDLGASGPDNDFGYGRLDLLGAYQWLTGIPASGQADLSVAKLDDPDPVSVGAVLTYTLSITNAGPAPATAVTVTDTLPVEATYEGISAAGWSCGHVGGRVTCTLPNLEVGIAPTILITVTAPAERGIITNTATVTAQEADLDQARNRATTTTAVRVAHRIHLPLIRK